MLKYSSIEDEKVIIHSLLNLTNSENIVMQDFQNKQQELNNKNLINLNYLKDSYIKMYNLFTGCKKLLNAPPSLPDETKILIRSMYEHYINFNYIYTGEDKEVEHNINRYYDYMKNISPILAGYKTLKKFFDSKQNNNILLKECHPELVSQRENYEKFIEIIKKFKDEYKITNEGQLNNWAGKSIEERQLEAPLIIYFNRIFNDCSSYVHSSKMIYSHENGAITNMARPKDIIEALVYMNLFWGMFVESFYFKTNLDYNFIEHNYRNKFLEIINKYSIEY